MKKWSNSKAGQVLSCLMIFLAMGLSRLRADTVSDFEADVQDPVLARGNSIEIKQSEFDQAAGVMKFEYLARGRSTPDYFPGAVIKNLIEYDLLSEQANYGDRAKGAFEANNDDVTNHINECGSLAKYDQMLDSSGLTEDDVRAIDTKADVAQIVLTRLLNISISDADARRYYDDNPAEFRYPDESLVEFTNVEGVIKHYLEAEQFIKRGPDFIHQLKDHEQVHILDPDLLFAYNAFELSQSAVALHAPAIVLPAPRVKSISFNVNNFEAGNGVIEHGVLTLRSDGTGHWSAVVFTYHTTSGDVWQVGWDILDKDGVKLFSPPVQSGPTMYSGDGPGLTRYHWDVDFKYDVGFFDRIKRMILHGSCKA